MSEYGNKDGAVSNAERAIDRELRDLHPTDRSEAYRELGKYSNAVADRQESLNERSGVPERPEDQKETAISDRMDGSR